MAPILVQALDGLDLLAESRHVTALQGPNGAGKTTFVNAVATLLEPDEGDLRVAGVDPASEPRRVRQTIGLAGQRVGGAHDDGPENLTWVARRFGLGRREAWAAAAEVLEAFGETSSRYGGKRCRARRSRGRRSDARAGRERHE